jgi:secreted trypsin-like serine protease
MKSSLIVVLGLLSLAAGCSSPPTKESKSEQAVQAAAAVGTTYEVAPLHSQAGDTGFKAAFDLQQNPSGLEPQLRHGVIAKSIEWPASLYATFSVPGGTAACTSALIGPQVMLTAAHCVPSNGKVTIRFSNKNYDTKCTQHSRYGNDASADFALCKLNQPFSGPTGFQFETVDTSGMDAMLNQKIILTGFGCISDIVGAGPSDNQYRIASNNIDETSSSPAQRRGPQYYAGKENNNLFTVDDPQLANLCPGDSGGPAFRLSADGGNLTSRVIVGVNSRVFYRNALRTSCGSSMIAATGGPDFRKWAEDWTKSNGVAACGIAGALPNCRN